MGVDVLFENLNLNQVLRCCLYCCECDCSDEGKFIYCEASEHCYIHGESDSLNFANARELPSRCFQKEDEASSSEKYVR